MSSGMPVCFNADTERKHIICPMSSIGNGVFCRCVRYLYPFFFSRTLDVVDVGAALVFLLMLLVFLFLFVLVVLVF